MKFEEMSKQLSINNELKKIERQSAKVVYEEE